MKGQNGRRSSWTGIRLGDVVEPRETRNPSKEGPGQFLYVDIEALDNGSQRIISPKRIANTSAPSRARMALRGGDVLFSLVRPYLKNIAIVPPELHGSVASTAYCVLRPKEAVDSRFLFYQLIQDSVINSVPTYGTSPPAARDEEFLNTVIHMTTGPEQALVADKLDELFSDLDAGVAALQRAKANLGRYRAAVLKAAVEGKLTEQWRREHPDVEPASELLKRILAERRKRWEEEQLKKYEATGRKPPRGWKGRYTDPPVLLSRALPRLPQAWCWASVAQMKGWAIYGPRFSSNLYSEEGTLVLRTTDFDGRGGLDLETPPRIQLPAVELAKYRVHQNDLLVTRTGSLGTVAVYPGGPDAIAGAFLIHYRLCVTQATVAYVLHFLLSPMGQRRLLEGGRGVGRPNLSMPSIDAIPVPLPPVAEQEAVLSEVARLLTTADACDTTTAAATTRANHLRQAVLHRAFSGDLV